MTDSGNPRPVETNGHGHSPFVNRDVQFEPSDVATSGVLVFVAGLVAVLIICGVGLAGLFRLLESGDSEKNESVLTAAPGNQLPVEPRLEGINPSADAGRSWTEKMDRTNALPWQGFNVRIVPATGAGGDESAAIRERAAQLEALKKLDKVGEAIRMIHLPARDEKTHTGLDNYRGPSGASNSGRSVGGKP